MLCFNTRRTEIIKRSENWDLTMFLEKVFQGKVRDDRKQEKILYTQLTDLMISDD